MSEAKLNRRLRNLHRRVFALGLVAWNLRQVGNIDAAIQAESRHEALLAKYDNLFHLLYGLEY